ncbi:Cytidine deaminase [Talaromyces pinophilus]|nr:Cytidine deaminase [Talaromyces pinophilus]
MASDSHGLRAQELETLFLKAAAAKANAYCPYSKYRVGACILTRSGDFIDGANVENASSPVGMCAEQVVFGKAVVSGHNDFKAIAITSDTSPGASPCGKCRQFMSEFTTSSFPVFMYGSDGQYTVRTMNELLPFAFGRSE